MTVKVPEKERNTFSEHFLNNVLTNDMPRRRAKRIDCRRVIARCKSKVRVERMAVESDKRPQDGPHGR